MGARPALGRSNRLVFARTWLDMNSKNGRSSCPSFQGASDGRGRWPGSPGVVRPRHSIEEYGPQPREEAASTQRDQEAVERAGFSVHLELVSSPDRASSLRLGFGQAAQPLEASVLCPAKWDEHLFYGTVVIKEPTFVELLTQGGY